MLATSQYYLWKPKEQNCIILRSSYAQKSTLNVELIFIILFLHPCPSYSHTPLSFSQQAYFRLITSVLEYSLTNKAPLVNMRTHESSNNPIQKSS